MKLCIVCALPLIAVLNGVWRTCGSIWGAITSMQINALTRGGSGVDKNLFGVSGQVTASGVLAFIQIFAALRAGKAVYANAASK